MDDNEFRSSGEPAEDTPAQVVGRDAKGRFGPGNSGRPKGLRFRATRAAEELLDGELESLTRRCIDAANEGDMIAMRLVMDRALPARKNRPVKFELPPLKTAADGPLAIAAIAAAAADGDLTADESEGFLRIIDSFLKAFEIGELEVRLRAVELATSR